MRSIHFAIFNSLVAHNQQLQATKEGLAIDWEPAKDGLSILIKLRRGVKFHDGTDFNAQAVKFNIERLQDPKMKSPQGGYAEPIAAVEVVDDYTVNFRLKRPSPALMETFGLQGGLIISPAAAKKYGDDFGRNPVGTGPFQFVSWDRGGHVVLKRFDGYWGKDKDGNQLPYLDGMDFAIIPDSTVAFANLRTGSVDMFRDVAYSDLATLKQNQGLTYSEEQQTTLWGVYMNTSKPPFDNKALRQAIALGIDRAGIVKGVYGEGAAVVENYLIPLSWAYDPAYKYPFAGADVAKAKAKLAEAGYPQGLKVEFLGADRREDTLIAETIQQSLAKIGVTLDLKLINSAQRLDLMNTLQYSIGWSGYTIYADPELSLTNRFHSTAGSRNRAGYKSPQVDALLDKAGSLYDQKERTSLYRQAGEIIMDDAGFVPNDVYRFVFGLSKKVKNFVQFYDGVERFTEVWLEK
ncbi:MAG: ABC transporter substrate-binding protein [Dehalococcoidia bacterium]|nr:ABC transporter substrate-binding protein [Dehalococcoidia bacterium]